MLLALVFFAGAMCIVGFAAWFWGKKSQPFRDETDWDERLLRPRPPMGFENLSAGDLELAEIEIMEDLATDDLGSLVDDGALQANSGYDEMK